MPLQLGSYPGAPLATISIVSRRFDGDAAKRTIPQVYGSPRKGWILSGTESAQEPDRYGDESSESP